MTPYFLLLNTLRIFRVVAIEEEVGLDISHCKGSAYDLSMPRKEVVEQFEISKNQKKGGSSEEVINDSVPNVAVATGEAQ